MTLRTLALLLLLPTSAWANLQFAGYVSVCDARGEPTDEVLSGVWVTGFYAARNDEDRGRATTTDDDGYFYLDGAYNGNEQYCYRDNGFQCEVRFERPGYEPTVYRDRWYNDNNNNDLRHFTDDQDLAVGVCLTLRPEAELGDADDDGAPDESDNCPYLANPEQGDADDDGRGDLCDPTPNGGASPFAGDRDRDGEPDAGDNCPTEPNQDQADADGDGTGDACDGTPWGASPPPPPPPGGEGEGEGEGAPPPPGPGGDARGALPPPPSGGSTPPSGGADEPFEEGAGEPSVDQAGGCEATPGTPALWFALLSLVGLRRRGR